jgi:arachidonate 15-lipoxygenase
MAGLTITEKSGQVKSVQQLVNEKRLFMLDYRDMADFVLHEEKFFYAAVMLVYREILDENNSRLNVLGIQLDPSSNEVFTPDMPQKNRYKLAKMFVACADNQIHEFQYHMGFGHLGVEGAVVAIHNRLPKASKKNPESKPHPLRALLEPHLDDTIGINFMARLLLVPEKYAFTDKPFSIGTVQGMKLASKGWARYDFFKSSFPEDLKARGFDEAGTDGLQNYFYREDGFKLWNALGDYTTDAVNHIYADDEAVKADGDLQKWADEMAAKDGAAYTGFPESIGTKKLLAHVLQILIWNFSALHSILDFPQWTYVGYIPNRPNALYQPMPELGEDKADIDEAYIKKCLAPKLQTLFQTTFPWLLSLPSEANLTDLAALKGIHDDVDANFQKSLAKLTEEIKARNAKLEAEGKAPYLYLLPEKVACSVDI